MSVLSNDQWAQLLNGFLQEAVDLLEQAETALLELDRGSEDHELIHGLFRNVHTLKGSAGLFALDGIVAFAHRMESRIMRARDGGEALSPEEISSLLGAVDILRGEVAHLEAGGASRALAAEHSELLDRIEAGGGVIASIESGAAEEPPGAEGRWHVSIRFERDLFASGLDPASLVRYLGSLGEVVHVATLTDALPDWDGFDPEQCYLGLELSLVSEASKAEIEDVFSFLADTATVRILPPQSRTEDYIRLIEQLPENPHRLGEILIAAGVLTRRELQIGLGLQSAAAGTDSEVAPKLGELLVEEGMLAPPTLEAALRKQAGLQQAQRKGGDGGFLRVSARKMDELINLVGELVTAAAGAEARARGSVDPEFLNSASEINRHVEQIREVALGLRMVEIGETFNRFQRLVRDVASELGKAIELRIEGAETELDKTLVERIGDPLTHLVRNAIDHGIESVEQRRAAGKPEQGRVKLAARHEAGSVVIEISDDGRGLDPQKIRSKAVARGLISAEAEMTDAALRELIFAPGFSTADQISNLSGRGVGMDVVKRTVEDLRGSIEIESTVGAGCCFRIRLPLTLAIIDGFMVEVAGTTLVLPLGMVTECFEAPVAARGRAEAVCDLRGRPLPLLCLRRHLRFEGAPARRHNVVVVDTGRERIGLLVDSLQGQQQVVIKPMGALFRDLHDIAGATILGSGSVALILDIARLAQSIGHTQAKQAA